MSFCTLEHKFIQTIRNQELVSLGPGVKLWVSCSGGLDSVALFWLLQRVRPLFKYELGLLHVHHGEGQGQQGAYRDKALEFCQDLAQKKGVDLSFFKAPKFLNSEEEAREFRLKIYEGFQNDVVVQAHHRDDFVETLLLRMIRGTGAQGFKAPHKELYKGFVWRPFLRQFSREELKGYLEQTQKNWVEDPSNGSADFLRNWLRNDWLLQLEKRQKGALRVFQQSLLDLQQGLQEGSDPVGDVIWCGTSGEVDLGWFSVLTRVQKQTFLSRVLLKLCKKGYTAGQVKEVLKRLDSEQKKIEFKVAGISWRRSLKKLEFKKDLG